MVIALVLAGCGNVTEMDESEFWHLIETSREGTDDPWAQADRLATLLGQKFPHQIVAFDRIFQRKMQDAHSWDLWALAYIANGGASTDGFVYFRCWLIGQGQTYFEQVINDPHSFAPVPGVFPGMYENEQLLYVAMEASRSGTGEEIPPPELDPTASWEPSGEPWKEEDLPTLFPEVSNRFNNLNFAPPGSQF
ncbi:MAG: DUF4240 domain-containing protein [Synoicihabitans sp.]